MEKFFCLVLACTVFFAVPSGAEDFLGLPPIPGAEVIQKASGHLETRTDLTHDAVIAFYRKALGDVPDIKFREWQDATYIEDDGKLPWHSITVSKGEAKETTVVIVKDNWTWIFGTLVIRYVGVFVVLLVLFLGMSLSGKVISAAVARLEAKKEPVVGGGKAV
jgi:hypothetical protein